MSTITSPASDALPAEAQFDMLVDTTLDTAKAAGASAAETAVSFSTALSTTVRLGDVETLEHHRNRSLAVTVYFGCRRGSASTSDWGADAVRSTVEAACAIARHTAEDPCAGLADPERLAWDVPDLDLFHPWGIDAEGAITLARRCEAAALEQDPRVGNSEGGSLASQSGRTVYGNSHGFRGGYSSTRHSISCSVLSQDDRGMQRDYWYTLARDANELEDSAEVGRRAAERALRRLGARRLDTRQAPVLFAPELARGLIGHFIGAIRGGALYRKASFLLDHLGKSIFPSEIRIREQPHLPKALGSAPFDGEGVATVARDLVRDGVLQGYVLDSYAARRLGMQTTGNAGGMHNVVVAPGSLDFKAMLRRMDTGLLVTELMGHGVNLVTGDYSRGAAGFWVEGGEILFPVEELTIAGNLRDMFASLTAVGNDMDTRGKIRCGSLLIERMTLAGK